MNINIEFHEGSEIIKFFLKHKCFQEKNREILSKEEIKLIIRGLLKSIDLPDFLSAYPDSIYNEFILRELSLLLWNTTTTPIRKYLIDKEISPSAINIKKTSNNRIKARILGAEGLYPNTAIGQNKNILSFKNGVPLLITEDNDTDYSSEIQFINSEELKMSAAIMLTIESRTGALYFDNHNLISINAQSLDGLNNQTIVDLLFELLLIKSTRDERPSFFTTQEVSLSRYKFYDFEKTGKEFSEIYNSINRNDELLMRVLFYLVKSRMLWSNTSFGEDAIANVFFALEGTLLLIQRKQNLSDKQIDLSELKKFFINTFLNGENLFEFIQEGYDKRISIVHAHPNDGVEWTPFLMADDYFEYEEILKMLLVYVLTGKVIEDKQC